MGFYRGPNIVTNGLVLNLDAANVKSYVAGSTTWGDLSGNNNNGTLTNGPTFSSANGGTIVFDGVDDFITGSGSPAFAFGTGDFTVDFWGYFTASSGLFVDLRTNTTGTGPGYSDYFLNNKFYLYWSNATRYSSTGSLSLNTWNSVTTTRSSSVVSVYFNGALDGTVISSTNFTEGGFRLGRNVNVTATGYLKGGISNVKIYNRALSASEILQNYNSIKSRFNL